MTDIDLKIPVVKQPDMSNDCGVACVAMIADFYGLGIAYEDIKNEIGVYSWGTTTPQLGRFLLAHRFDVEIIGLHPALFQLNSTSLNEPKLIEHLQKMRTVLKDGYDAIAIEHFLSFVREGGQLTPRIPTVLDIELELAEQRPLIIPLSHWFLHQTNMPPRFSIHFNVVTGTNEKNFIVNDPDFGDDFGGQHEIEKSVLMYAIYVSAKGGIDDACIMRIKKRL